MPYLGHDEHGQLPAADSASQAPPEERTPEPEAGPLQVFNPAGTGARSIDGLNWVSGWVIPESRSIVNPDGTPVDLDQGAVPIVDGTVCNFKVQSSEPDSSIVEVGQRLATDIAKRYPSVMFIPNTVVAVCCYGGYTGGTNGSAGERVHSIIVIE